MRFQDKPGWNEFTRLCHAATRDQQTLNELFDFLFTDEEKEHLATRILLVSELLKGEKTQRDIAKDLHISIAKITRGSNGLKRIGDELREFLIEQLV